MTMTAKDTNTSTQQPIWLQEYIDSPERQAKLYKKTLRILMFSQIFGGAGLLFRLCRIKQQNVYLVNEINLYGRTKSNLSL